jgi:hypothetical protein
MQTFLPYPDYRKSAKALDYRRLGKQRVEAMQILKVLSNPDAKGWRNHPAVKMWRGYEDALGYYMNAMIDEWVERGYKNTMVKIVPRWPCDMPPWLGDNDFHRAHQSNLIRKDAAHYGPLFPGVPSDLPYVWPM